MDTLIFFPFNYLNCNCVHALQTHLLIYAVTVAKQYVYGLTRIRLQLECLQEVLFWSAHACIMVAFDCEHQYFFY